MLKNEFPKFTVFLNAEGTDDIIDAEIANLKKVKAFLHGK